MSAALGPARLAQQAVAKDMNDLIAPSFNALYARGLPPEVIRAILTQPSYAENETHYAPESRAIEDLFAKENLSNEHLTGGREEPFINWMRQFWDMNPKQTYPMMNNMNDYATWPRGSY